MNTNLPGNLRLLDKFYRIAFVLAVIILVVGVPFFLVRRIAGLVTVLALLAGIGVCWSMARRGQPERSLLLFAALAWVLLVVLLFLGVEPTFAGFMLAISMMLAVVVNHRVGQLYAVSYMATWLAYIVLGQLGWTPPRYFPVPIYTQWFFGAIAVWLVLLPIPSLVSQLRAALNRVEEEAARRRVVEAELVASRDAALVASRAKNEFLASMSHELRTPLNAILGFSELIEMNPDARDATREQAGDIRRAGAHLLSLVNDVIDLARIEAGKLVLSMEPVLLKPLLAQSVKLVGSLAGERDIEIRQEASAGAETLAVRADHNRLLQAVINLLSNAIKYNRPRGSVTLSCSVREGTVRINVVDTGRGVAADKQERIFRAFERLGEERGNVEGTGIGLVITRHLVEAMGGAVGFESVVEQGSTFWIELPVAHGIGSPGTHEALPVEITRTGPAQPARCVVLYIEDNPANLRLMRAVFAARQDLLLRDARSAELGIDIARSELPTAILMDINLPGLDGYAALKALKSDPRTGR
ncbi:MAG: ATP-binding protein, partial [Betaproteobacteria bacterium]|nr:ATP-binding protein [Betaproteobacteria bacterium]